MSGYRTPPPFDSTRADRILVTLCVLVIVGCLAYVILAGTGAV